MRGIEKKTKQWHALKCLSRASYAPQREIDALQKVSGHPNIVSFQGVFAPVGKRPQWVLAMIEDDFTLHDYLQRSRGQLRRRTDAVIRDLARQLLNGIAHIHANGMMHRDLKPLNIMLSVSPAASQAELELGASQAGMVLAIGDFSRARQAPPRTRATRKTADVVVDFLVSAAAGG